jgi:hypothetical protein
MIAAIAGGHGLTKKSGIRPSVIDHLCSLNYCEMNSPQGDEAQLAVEIRSFCVVGKDV